MWLQKTPSSASGFPALKTFLKSKKKESDSNLRFANCSVATKDIQINSEIFRKLLDSVGKALIATIYLFEAKVSGS